MDSLGFQVVCRFDEAIDADAMTYEEREEFKTFCTPRVLKYLPGQSPTVFHCRRLKLSEMQAVRGYTTEADVWQAAFCRGVLRIQGLRLEDRRTDWVRPDDSRAVTVAELEAAGVSYAEIQEVGAAIYGRSILGKGRPAAWPLPDTSRDAVRALVSQRVAQTSVRAASPLPSKSAAEPVAPDPQP